MDTDIYGNFVTYESVVKCYNRTRKIKGKEYKDKQVMIKLTKDNPFECNQIVKIIPIDVYQDQQNSYHKTIGELNQINDELKSELEQVKADLSTEIYTYEKSNLDLVSSNKTLLEENKKLRSDLDTARDRGTELELTKKELQLVSEDREHWKQEYDELKRKYNQLETDYNKTNSDRLYFQNQHNKALEEINDKEQVIKRLYHRGIFSRLLNRYPEDLKLPEPTSD